MIFLFQYFCKSLQTSKTNRPAVKKHILYIIFICYLNQKKPEKYNLHLLYINTLYKCVLHQHEKIQQYKMQLLNVKLCFHNYFFFTSLKSLPADLGPPFLHLVFFPPYSLGCMSNQPTSLVWLINFQCVFFFQISASIANNFKFQRSSALENGKFKADQNYVVEPG